MKYIFFRNDDVWELDENLKRLIDIFLVNRIPLHLSVIPGKLTKDCKDFLIYLVKRFSNLIELGQHGFKHLNYSNVKDKFSKYEFGEKRSYKEQKTDIIKGKKVMESIIDNIKVFTPPWHGFDGNTLKILAEEKYLGVSTDLKSPALDNIRGLKSIPTSIYLSKRDEKGWHIAETEEVVQKIGGFHFSRIGIQIHHSAFNGSAEFNHLKNLLRKLKKNNLINFIRLSEAFEENISGKGVYLNSLLYYLTYQFVPKPLTLTADSKNSLHKEYDFSDISDYPTIKRTEAEISKELYLKLKETIKRQLPKNNKPIGLLLSGGMDSAAILHILRELTDKEIFTVTGAYSKDAPNLKLAKRLSNKYKTIHKNIIINQKDLVRIEEIYSNNIPQSIGDNGFLPTYIMMDSIKEHVSHVFTGDGADCLFCGLSSHYLNFIEHKYLKDLNLTKLKNRRIVNYFNENMLGFEHYKNGEIFLEEREVESLLTGRFRINLKTPLKLETDKIKTKDFIKKQILLDLRFLVKNRVDYVFYSAKIANLEVKMPFLDKNLVNFIIKIPSKYFIKNLKQKYILKKAFEKSLPKEVLNKVKEGFSPPFYLLYNNNKNFVIKKLIKSTRLGISKDYITYLIKNLDKSDNYQIGMRIWLILNLVCWLENRKFKF